MDILLFGIQGSGKGTQGKLLKDYYDMAYFETGAELRRLAQEDKELGKKVKEIIEAGHLVPNEVVMDIVENFMDNVPEGKAIFFDGIPRKMVQKETLDALLNKHSREFKVVILDLTEELALERLTKRRICSKCKEVYPAKYDKDVCEKCGGELITRTDDNAESIKVRLQAFADETMPVVNKYEEEGKLIHVDGSGSIEEVDKLLKETLDPILK
ncbi:adenylate kinase family protein [Patescibacteria group bacterium]